MDDSTLLVLVIAVFAIYVVARQFTEQQVTTRSLLLLPALSVYASYMDLQSAFAQFSPTLLIVGLALGVVPGILVGIFRGRHTQVRLDRASGFVFSRPDLFCSGAWLALLIIRIAVIALSYSPLSHDLVVGMATAFAGSLFLLSVSTQKYLVYLRYKNFLDNGSQQQVFSQPGRW